MSVIAGKPRKVGDKWNGMLYSHPGAGKTTLVSDAPGVCFIDVNNETMVLAYTKGKENTPVIHAGTNGEVNEALDALINKELFPDTRTIVLDTLSELQMIQQGASAAQLKKGRDWMDLFVPIEQDFNISTQMCRNLMVKMHKSRFNTLIVCHRLDYQDKDTKQMTVRPLLTPKFSNNLLGAVDFCLFLERKREITGKLSFTLRANPTNIIVAKNRLGLPDEFPADQFWSMMKER